MSLLIDALKQAEATRKTPPERVVGSEPAEALSLAPIDETPPSSHSRSSDSKSAQRRKETVSRMQEQQAAARQMFEVKRSTALGLPALLGIGALLCLLAGSAYVWWAIQPRGMQLGPALTGTQPPGTPVPPLPYKPLTEPWAGSGRANPVEQNPVAPSVETPDLAVSARLLPPKRAQATSADALTEDVVADAMPTKRTPDQATSYVQPGSTRAASILPAAARAHEAYLAGDLSLARIEYREALAAEPGNVDALNALGTIALRDGRLADAEARFRAVLAVDPRNATAQAQLALTQADSDPVRMESRLKLLTVEQPDAAVAFFSLGSLYAQQGRWREAQQTFFKAHTLDAANADTLYNLAVSLDHLGQNKLAHRYYAQAVSAAQPQTATFDIEVARQRALKLSGANTPAGD